MKKAYTLVEIIVVVVILSILASIALPGFKMIKKRIEYKETSGVVGLVRAGAKYYDLKYGLTELPAGDNAWTYLKVDKPSDVYLVYEIVDDAGVKYMRIKNQSGDLLYSYKLPDGPRETIPEQDDMQYLPEDLP
jgi:prepilin-type N-terminal cleavage/methylation domain-containing protein